MNFEYLKIYKYTENPLDILQAGRDFKYIRIYILCMIRNILHVLSVYELTYEDNNYFNSDFTLLKYCY